MPIGRHTIVELLDRGGMGEVLPACDNELGRLVAMKFGAFTARIFDGFVKRLISEAQAA